MLGSMRLTGLLCLFVLGGVELQAQNRALPILDMPYACSHLRGALSWDVLQRVPMESANPNTMF